MFECVVYDCLEEFEGGGVCDSFDDFPLDIFIFESVLINLCFCVKSHSNSLSPKLFIY